MCNNRYDFDEASEWEKLGIKQISFKVILSVVKEASEK